jgi:hypothetical protein
MAKMTLDDLAAQLRAAYGRELRAVVLYGSAAASADAGNQGATRGGYNILVVVDRLGMRELRAVAATTRAWGEAGNPPPLTLTTAEWRSSADVFPMEYADVLERHRILHGALPTEGIRVDPGELRTEVEQQALGKLLQLRQGVLVAGGDPKRQLELLEVSLSTLMAIFRGAARLRGEVPAAEYEALARATGAAARFDPAPFVRVVRHVRGAERLTPAAAEEILAEYLAAMEALVAHVDRLAPGGPGGGDHPGAGRAPGPAA